MNGLTIFLVILSLIGNIFIHQNGEKSIEKFESERLSASNELSRIKKNFLTETQENIETIEDSPDRIDDLGKLQEIFRSITDKNIEFYAKLAFLKNYNVKLNRFSSVGGAINNKMPSQIPTYQIAFGGDLINESGDIDDLFASFDDLNSAVRKEYEGNEINGKEMARDMDFTKKYNTYPITFTINKNTP